jgi:2-dehydro-3-deoxyphosphooctonate aldolase (KDO 8-P synthase)
MVCSNIAMPHPSHFTLGDVALGGGPLFLIAGPCVIESEAHARRMADAIQRIASDLRIQYIFKASYDKANRTSIHSFRGPGIAEGARILRSIAESNRLPVLTDIHTAEQATELSDRLGPVDAMLQVPAFLCRQTDLLIAAGRACAAPNRAVNVKKGQFVAPWDMRHAVEKVRESGSAGGTGEPARVTLTERGASFGYNNLVVDMRSLPAMRAMAPVIFDATHSVQTPSAASAAGSKGQAVSGGQPEFIPVLARAAVAAGIDGIFLEVHDNPAEAKSDGANALHLNRLRPVLETLLAIHALVPSA